MAFLEKNIAPEMVLEADGPDHQYLALSGDWTVSTIADAEKELNSLTIDKKSLTCIDVSQIEHLDTSGAWLIHRTRGRLEFEGRKVGLTGVSPVRQTLFEEIESHHPPRYKPDRNGFSIAGFLEATGRQMVDVYHDALAMLHILGSLGLVLSTVLLQPKRLRSISIAVQFDRSCIGAVPIVALMSFLIGAIISQQGGFYLRQFGADIFVVDLAGILVLREIGVILTAIMVAGRSGSAFTAELGAMRMQEEVDALHVIGLSVTEVLVLPRILALMIALPILTFISDLSALLGSGIVTWAYLDIPPAAFLTQLQAAITINTLVVGLVKAPFMALIVGLIACVEGLKVEGSSESLGRHTTMSVVKAIFLVIVVDGFFAIFFAAIGV
ncbi:MULTISPECIES: ABC transporter permease [Stappiaceae]|jgi:phospholipid/cholesterol/gamma-HCH transport system permease protein|uniref:ABC transporter permease n=1 Tax=Stappiaceae TaxID=2821832 RepID=UPI001268C0C6|nr:MULTISPECIES: ABC transporter permease [Stappiaceae]MBN8182082.1 ABC transporter permease [Roseibium aggregatum]QFS98971.1 putative phospholipid ABC transporter permease protein MlaE [Labrenzia sp. THAF191b]QFT05285.1 putative phospholipid ABC transporter permease protein MlaE [Labrenzia sp. THAF191a]QFT16829.1 putative phospholipid ABC transporter permease protein MlaE [Labrenzia sp. THAF187b]